MVKTMQISSIFIHMLLLLMLLSLLSLSTKSQSPTQPFEYLNHSCTNTTFSTNDLYLANRDTVLSSLSSNSARRDGFYNTTAGTNPDIAYGLFLCRGDIPTSLCKACVTFAATDITRLCPVETTVVLWYDVCLIRYSNRNIFSVLAETPAVYFFRSRNITEQDSYNRLVTGMMNDAASQAANRPPGAKKFATREANFSSTQTVYALVQCTPDLSATDCNRCLQGAIANLSDCCSRMPGARFLKPSCNIRYQTFQFYDQGEEKRNESKWITILVSSLSVTFGLALVSVSGFFIWRRRKARDRNRENSQEIQLLNLIHGKVPSGNTKKSFSGENEERTQEFPSIQLNILLAATNHFSDENKLGEGGFGPVYKGTLSDGKEIAVKRLSITSGQGFVEFKNEIMLMAKLQHRNLVRLFGCCLEKNEKLLVYEFMPKRSLDIFLFNSNLAAQLDWQKRFNIVKGIARGIMYLHEDSRLRIIHRDLKASNILLDQNMNAKISDFGMARIFGEDKKEANTRRVVGTYGYMAPEYAMRGLFSVKSDVFSFGVLLLEIISGKRNSSFHHSESDSSLLTFAWNLWCKGEGMELIDRLLVPSCVASEVLKCIHIGLLCVQNDPGDRPTMSSVIFMLASDYNVALPHPTEPAFFVGDAKALDRTTNEGVFSINEVSISSNFSPR